MSHLIVQPAEPEWIVPTISCTYW